MRYNDLVFDKHFPRNVNVKQVDTDGHLAKVTSCSDN